MNQTCYSPSKVVGKFSPLAFIIRMAGLVLFRIMNPFWASIINESLDVVDHRVSPKISHYLGSSLMIMDRPRDLGYQVPDKVLDTVGYLVWLLVIWKQSKWYTPLLTIAFCFRLFGIGKFIQTCDESYLTSFPNFFIFWYWIMTGSDYFGIHISSFHLVILLFASVGLKIINEHMLRGPLNDKISGHLSRL